jgi:hypothetical protein
VLVDLDAPGLGEPAPQRRRQLVAGVVSDREEGELARDHRAVGEPHASQVAARTLQRGRTLLDDDDAVAGERLAVRSVALEGVAVGDERDRARPVEQRECEAGDVLVPAEHHDVAAARLEPVAGRAVEQVLAVVLVDAADAWKLVDHAGGEPDPTGVVGRARRQLDRERAVDADDLVLHQLDVAVAVEVAACRLEQLAW